MKLPTDPWIQVRVSMFVVQAPSSPWTDSTSIILWIGPTSLLTTLCYCFSPHQLKLLDAMSIDDLGDVYSRDQYNRCYGLISTLLLLSNLCGSPSLFHSIFCSFKHTLLNAPRHAMQTFRLMLYKTRPTPLWWAAVLLALLHTVRNLKL